MKKLLSRNTGEKSLECLLENYFSHKLYKMFVSLNQVKPSCHMAKENILKLIPRYSRFYENL